MATINFTYNDFNLTTRRNADTKKHGTAEVRQDTDGNVYLHGSLGCGKSRSTVREALVEYLGGRELLQHEVQG